MPEHDAEKDLYDLIMANVTDFIHEPANADRLVQSMQGGDPAAVVGQTAADVLGPILDSAASKGQVPTPDVAMAAAATTIKELIELGEAANTIDVAEGQGEAVAEQAMGIFMEIAKGSAQAQPEQAPVEQPTGAIAGAMGGQNA